MRIIINWKKDFHRDTVSIARGEHKRRLPAPAYCLAPSAEPLALSEYWRIGE